MVNEDQFEKKRNTKMVDQGAWSMESLDAALPRIDDDQAMTDKVVSAPKLTQLMDVSMIAKESQDGCEDNICVHNENPAPRQTTKWAATYFVRSNRVRLRYMNPYQGPTRADMRSFLLRHPSYAAKQSKPNESETTAEVGQTKKSKRGGKTDLRSLKKYFFERHQM